jgi:nicotinate phosphoribosyltransferase
VDTSADAPTLDTVYKLTAYAGEGRVKLSTNKHTLPGRKQVFRRTAGGVPVGDVITAATESAEGEPLLRLVMRDGRRLPDARPSLAELRAHAGEQLRRLPPALRALEPAATPYPVTIGPGLARAAAAAEDAARRASRDA